VGDYGCMVLGELRYPAFVLGGCEF
jgi:hypothetical protein